MSNKLQSNLKLRKILKELRKKGNNYSPVNPLFLIGQNNNVKKSLEI